MTPPLGMDDPPCPHCDHSLFTVRANNRESAPPDAWFCHGCERVFQPRPHHDLD